MMRSKGLMMILLATYSRAVVGFSHKVILRRGWQVSLRASTIAGHAPTPPSYSSSTTFNANNGTIAIPKVIIHWKGECDKNFSVPFRQLEFINSLAAVLGEQYEAPKVEFINALECPTDFNFGQDQIHLYNEAMQYINFHDIPVQALYDATERCSLVHAMYQVVAASQTLEELLPQALENGGFDDMVSKDSTSTWCVRARHYGNNSVGRHSHKARSMKLEQKVLKTLAPLLATFTGDVRLSQPDCKIYVLDGLLGEYPIVLARRRAVGPITSTIAPTTRICITNTPLPPTAAYTLCNVARIQNGQTILDPYAGSCTILLASAMIAPGCRSVGIEIAPNGSVNRDHVVLDFTTRNLVPPVALLLGDSTMQDIRDDARAAIGGDGFDVICTDPPYGVRESAKHNELNPLDHLFQSIAQDAALGKRLLKVGGRVVAFVPVMDDETLEECLPSTDLRDQAGMELEVVREQVLNENFSRWLVAYRCVQ